MPGNPHEVPLKSGDGAPFFVAPHPVLAVGKVRHVGEAIAVVVGETLSQATDAAERVEVRYEPLSAVTRSADALVPEAPLVWEEHGANLCVDSEAGDPEATDAAFARAAHVVRLETAQSTEADEGQRKKLVWDIERKPAEDGARPIIFYNRFAYCWQPQVKGWTMMVNSIINDFRMEDVWLDK